MIRPLLAALPVLLALASPAAAAPPGVEASLVAEVGGITPGAPFTVAIRMRMRPGWHVYWRNPGDSGLPPGMAWSLPPGFSAGPIAWPAPERIPVGAMMNFGYAGAIDLLVRVTPPAELPPGPVRLGGTLDYLACERECVPGSAALGLELPAGPAEAAPGTAEAFARARAALPAPAPWPVALGREGERALVTLAMPESEAAAVRSATFFPIPEGVIDHAAAQEFRPGPAGLVLALDRASPADPFPGSLPGVVVLRGADGTTRAYAVDPGSSTPAPAAPAPASAPFPPAVEAPSLLVATGLAFLGGLLLNLMPCVFPVLSIKVMGLVRQAGASPRAVRRHGLAYAAGVMTSFLALAGTLLALKDGGAGLGWGFQLQSPAFVAGLASLLLALALSLSGVFHLGGRLSGFGDGLARREGLAGSFFTGVLATVVAAPCTAPFMGTAVGFALTQAAAPALAVFLGLGAGLSAPFLLLTARPALLARLPRPGAWMETLRQALAFPVYATVAWLVWVLAAQVGADGLAPALAGLVLVGLGAWAWGKAGVSTAPAIRGLALAAGAGAAVLAVGLRPDPRADGTRRADPSAFTQARLDGLTGAGRPVLVDATAAWCITCKLNERTSLADARVRAALAERDVTLLVADWTNGDPEVTRLLERHGRAGVPLYLLYGTGPAPVILPQLLSPDTVLDALARIPTRPRPAA